MLKSRYFLPLIGLVASCLCSGAVGQPEDAHFYLDFAGYKSPFAIKTFDAGKDGWFTSAGDFIPGSFVGWDPKSGDPIMLNDAKFAVGTKVLATIPAGYQLSQNKAQNANGMYSDWTNIICYRTAKDNTQSRVSSPFAAVITPTGEVRALLQPKQKGGTWALLDGQKLKPLPPIQGSLSRNSYKLDALHYQDYDSTRSHTLVRDQKIQFVTTVGAGVSGFLSNKGLIITNLADSLTLGTTVLRGQNHAIYPINRVIIGQTYSAFLPDGTAVEKQTGLPNLELLDSYGPLLPTDVPMYTLDSQFMTVAMGNQSLKVKIADLNAPRAFVPNDLKSADFITTLTDGALNCWSYEDNQMIRYSAATGVVSKQFSTIRGQRPEILSVSPYQNYAVVRLFNQPINAWVIYLIELKSGKTQAITLRNTAQHNIAFVGEEEICVQYSWNIERSPKDSSITLLRKNISELMATAKTY